MKEFTVPMAVADYVPVILFFLAVRIIMTDCRKRLAGAWGAVFMIGALMVFAAGMLKATYKLLYALNIADVSWMNGQFFSNQAFGFLLAGCGLVMCLSHNNKTSATALLPTMALVGMMVVGLGAMDAALCQCASRLKKKSALACFITSFFLSLAMGYLSSRDFTRASMNWIAQGINLVGQLLLYVGCRMLHDAGLEKY